MIKILCILFYLQVSALLLLAQDRATVKASNLDSVVLKSNSLIINNLNVSIGDALMGGTKATAQCTGNNKSDDGINYTVYIAAFDSSENLIACFNLEPGMNIHEEGKIETLETSGMVSNEAKNSIDHFKIQLVVQ